MVKKCTYEYRLFPAKRGVMMIYCAAINVCVFRLAILTESFASLSSKSFYLSFFT